MTFATIYKGTSVTGLIKSFNYFFIIYIRSNQRKKEERYFQNITLKFNRFLILCDTIFMHEDCIKILYSLFSLFVIF